MSDRALSVGMAKKDRLGAMRAAAPIIVADYLRGIRDDHLRCICEGCLHEHIAELDPPSDSNDGDGALGTRT